MTWPVTRRAWCEARKTMTSATSSGRATRRSGPLSRTASSTDGLIHPVSVAGGQTMFAVTP